MRGDVVRCLRRNKRRFWFAPYVSKTPRTDEYGNDTGEYDIIHGNPIKVYGNISAAKGETQTEQFGNAEVYDKVIVMDDAAPVFDEYAVLWVDCIPELNEDGSLALDEEGGIKVPHDYIVVRVAKSLNSVSYAIRKVNVR